MTDLLTSLVLRNQRPAGIKPRLPSRYEKTRRDGTDLSKGSMDKVRPIFIPGSLVPREEESPLEIAEVREVQHPEPSIVRRPVVRGPAAFRTMTRVAALRSPAPEEIPEEERTGRPIMDRPVVSEGVRERVQAKPHADKGDEPSARALSLQVEPEPSRIIRRSAVGQPRQEVPPENGRAVPGKGATLEMRETGPVSSSIETREKRLPVRSVRKGMGTEAVALDIGNTRIPSEATKVHPSSRQTSGPEPSRMTAQESFRSVSNHPGADGKGKTSP